MKKTNKTPTPVFYKPNMLYKLRIQRSQNRLYEVITNKGYLYGYKQLKEAIKAAKCLANKEKWWVIVRKGKENLYMMVWSIKRQRMEIFTKDKKSIHYDPDF